MTFKVADRVKETTITTSTGTLDLGGAATGFQTFVDGILTTNTTAYLITDNTDWEIGIGTVTSGSPDTLSRDTVKASSNGGALVNWGAGTKDVACVLPANASEIFTDTISESTAANGVIIDGATLKDGGLTLTGIADLSAAGAYFGTAAAANLLDDYEEGTWTPGIADVSLDGSGEGQTYTKQVGTYTKIGNVVLVRAVFSISNLGDVEYKKCRSTCWAPIYCNQYC